MLRFSAHRTSAVGPLCQVGPRGWEEANFVFCSVAGFKWGSPAGRPTKSQPAGLIFFKTDWVTEIRWSLPHFLGPGSRLLSELHPDPSK